ncbi:unnamed protein product [Camellia sinensis]
MDLSLSNLHNPALSGCDTIDLQPLIMDNITIFGHMDGDLRRTVQFLQERNVNVVIRDERALNVIRKRKGNCQGIVEEKRKDHRFGQGKGKCMFKHITIMLYRKLHWLNVHGENAKEMIRQAIYLGQRSRRERERSRELIPPNTTNTPLAQKGVMFTHLPSPSTSLASQRNWNIGAKEKEKAKAMSKGKEKATSFDKGKENACPMSN